MSSSFQGFIIVFYVVSCSFVLTRAATVTNTILIFRNKEQLNRNGSQYILKFSLDVCFCPEFIFFGKSWIHFCLKRKSIFLLKVRFSTNNVLDFSRQKCDEMKKKQQLRFLPLKRKTLS